MFGFALAILGGHFLIIAAAVWVLDRVAGFHVTARERRNYKLLLPLLLAWSVLLALIGPLPLPVTLAINLAAITVWVWHGAAADSRLSGCQRMYAAR